VDRHCGPHPVPRPRRPARRRKALAGDRGSQFTASFDHYNTHRPRRALQQRPPSHADAVDTDDTRPPPSDNVIRFPRCGGLINEYENAA
jgi:hypothetical protein